MGNMSYCRFRNVIPDLEDCYEHLSDDLTNRDEIVAKERLIKLCKKIVEEYGEDE